ELATLKAAELPLDDALRILSQQTSVARLRTIVDALLADILNGATLSEAMQKQPQMFPPDYVSMVRAGEIGGTDSEVFVDLADLLERRLDIRGRVQSALIYPCILVALGIGAFAVVIGGLIPSVAPIFGDGRKPIPAVISFFLAIHAHWVEVVAGIAIAV